MYRKSQKHNETATSYALWKRRGFCMQKKAETLTLITGIRGE
jgi:hypothetical protein